jgi:hypothetical protein
LLAVIRGLIRRHGVHDTSWAFGYALYQEGKARSMAGVKGRRTLGSQGRKAAAKKAVDTKGVDGRQRAARKAAATRKARVRN